MSLNNIVNKTDDLMEGEKFDFIGKLITQDTPTGFDVILVLDDFQKV